MDNKLLLDYEDKSAINPTGLTHMQSSEMVLQNPGIGKTTITTGAGCFRRRVQACSWIKQSALLYLVRQRASLTALARISLESSIEAVLVGPPLVPC